MISVEGVQTSEGWVESYEEQKTRKDGTALVDRDGNQSIRYVYKVNGKTYSCFNTGFGAKKGDYVRVSFVSKGDFKNVVGVEQLPHPQNAPKQAETGQKADFTDQAVWDRKDEIKARTSIIHALLQSGKSVADCIHAMAKIELLSKGVVYGCKAFENMDFEQQLEEETIREE